MLRFAVGVTRKDKIRNEYSRRTVKVERLGMKMRESRLKWYGHVMKRDQKYVGRRMMEMDFSDVADTKFCVRSPQVFFICDTALHCTAKLLAKTYTAPRCTANHIFK